MDEIEANAWLSGERSSVNIVQCIPCETWEARTAEADAHMMEIAYWILRAHSEGLLREKDKIK